jgi:hypothetical protein
MSKEKKQVDPFATKENARAALFNPEQLHLLVAPDLSVMELLLVCSV